MMETATDPTVLGVLLTILGTMVTTLFFVVKNSRTSEKVNAAVNNVAPGTPPISSQVAELVAMARSMEQDMNVLVRKQDEFDTKGWPSLPADIGSAAALTATIRDLQHHDKEIKDKMDAILSELRGHVKWEEKESHKYDKVNTYIDLFMRDDEH